MSSYLANFVSPTPTVTLTRSSNAVDLLAPREALAKESPSSILACIAWSLARTQRFSGNGRISVSTACHSRFVSHITRAYLGATRHTALIALLHDAEEYLTGDVTRPTAHAIKGHGIAKRYGSHIGAAIGRAKESASHAVLSALHLDNFCADAKIIKEADAIALEIEGRASFAGWERKPIVACGAPLPPLMQINLMHWPLSGFYTQADWLDAAHQFLLCFAALCEQSHKETAANAANILNSMANETYPTAEELIDG